MLKFFYLFIFFFTTNIASAELSAIEHGKQVFNKRCSLCHFADKLQNRIGPSLHGVIGRKAGSLANYTYSAAMVKAGQNGLIWSKDNFEIYLHNPHKMIKGTKMAILFMNNQTELDDLVTYLSSLAK